MTTYRSIDSARSSVSPRSALNRAVFAAASAAVAALALTACGSGDSQAKGGGEGHGSAHGAAQDKGEKPAKGAAADVSFAEGMIPHHRQALEMAALASSRAESAQVKSLASRIGKAQKPEIEKLSGWLKSWGEKVPAAGGGAEHSEHSGHSMPGMMTSGDMEQLKKASGEKFDRQFLEMMTAHHQGAVEMARTEESKGSYKPAKDMARDIRRAQTGEIREMRELLKK
ncbi:DUF305 domain-containing protein [Streptomyces winkii]|uniref:DUF305 domain-containing protein n=1 Tax=Streptomyces winkii TaxID=3051178 RepID=UPI0028D16697|nr:DUF305 domain-containing protein [Streptomyces sp. DSM 40971]